MNQSAKYYIFGFGFILDVLSDLHKHIKQNNNELFGGHQSFRAYDIITVKPCFKCCRYYHKALKCTNNICCLKCAGNHLMKDCKNQETNKCVNCIYSNNNHNTQYDITHYASDSQECSILKNKIRKYINNTDYSFNPTIPRHLCSQNYSMIDNTENVRHLLK